MNPSEPRPLPGVGPCGQVFCDHRERPCVHLAVQDLAGDIAKVLGARPVIKPYLPRNEDGFILVGSMGNPAFRARVTAYGIDLSTLAGQWEGYRLQTFGANHQNLLLCGSDERGAMWAVYEFAEKHLGVDPLGFWTDHETERLAALALGPLFTEDAPRTFKYRGWFINDEDLLTEWQHGGGRRYIDYRFYRQVVHPDVFARVLETAVRLKQNLIIPASFTDIENPAEEHLVRLAVARGLFVTQHHIEALGVSHFALENYWQARGKEPPSFVADRERMIETWTHYARKWAQFGAQVIWQLGLRGRGDRPVWQIDPHIPATPEGRGAVISEAMACQRRIVAEVTGRDDFVATTTLWAEGTELHQAGHLRFPAGTIVVFADNLRGTDGKHQFIAHQWAKDFHAVARRPELRYGIYYHVAVWGAGPHLAQGVPPEKIESCIRQAAARGDTSYVITNVANLREVVLGIRTVAALTHDVATFELERFLATWRGMQFGALADEVRELYAEWQGAFAGVPASPAAHPALLHDGVLAAHGTGVLKHWFLELGWPLEDRLLRKGAGNPGEKFTPAPRETLEEYVLDLHALLAPSLARWRRVEERIHALAPRVPPERRAFYDHHFRIQALHLRALTQWVLALGQAYLAARDPGARRDETFRALDEAAAALGDLLAARAATATGKWQHWYRGDRKMDLPTLWQSTVRLREEYT
ncbi:MAG: glycosyl hydrolase 115 family protein [Candidatus Marinimicrobia bacterium]|nr:glycosyl hydrolase 115 family protein [Candidatus Neomarinimicrobiota bacterium]